MSSSFATPEKTPALRRPMVAILEIGAEMQLLTYSSFMRFDPSGVSVTCVWMSVSLIKTGENANHVLARVWHVTCVTCLRPFHSHVYGRVSFNAEGG